MINLAIKCSNQPCIIKFKGEDGWGEFAYSDEEMTVEKVFACDHEAFIYITTAINCVMTLEALGEARGIKVPVLEDFKLVHIDTLIDPPQHDDHVTNVAEAAAFLQKYRSAK